MIVPRLMKRLRIFLLAGLICCAALLFVAASPNTVTIAQLSDTHLGEEHSPQADANLRQAVKMVNGRHPDAVILSGDIGENEKEREQVKITLKILNAPVYNVPGNHDIRNTKDLESYRTQCGPDYYHCQVR